MHILVADDDDRFTRPLAAFLRTRGDQVTVAADGTAADGLLQHSPFDFALVEVNLAGVNGYELVRRLRSRRQTTPVIFISARQALEDRIHGLDLGADDYVVKPAEISEITARMRAVLRRGPYRIGDEMRFGPIMLDADGRLASLNGQALPLTGREWEILEALVAADGRTVAKDRLQADSGGNAAEVYISRLRPRLEPAGVLIRTVRGFGYRLELQAVAGEDAPG
ncbi:transcriptional regulator [Azoarcus olearius]|uniref:response regulator transcription factor n=1 Tax=Azoarcus sp. (strain BH72) TaxID=418699 RepID=UPI000806429C|nr:response regulator transcription factor [Azoarcus olearius]ANQ84118.1 transcriptional regulator [Azoarcus olearius]